LSIIRNKYPLAAPHIAVARVIYESEGNLIAYPLKAIFTSTIKHNLGERLERGYRQVITNLLYGIDPYYGLPNRFAHSERAVGIYLLRELGAILQNRRPNFVLIQIKTSSSPCSDCCAFWNNAVNIGKDKKTKAFLNFAAKKGEQNTVKVDWLQLLKLKVALPGEIAISINCSAKVNEDIEGKSSQPLERIL